MDDNPATSYNDQLKIENKTWLNGRQPGHSIVTFLYFGPILSVSKRTHMVKNIFLEHFYRNVTICSSKMKPPILVQGTPGTKENH